MGHTGRAGAGKGLASDACSTRGFSKVELELGGWRGAHAAEELEGGGGGGGGEEEKVREQAHDDTNIARTDSWPIPKTLNPCVRQDMPAFLCEPWLAKA